MDAALLARAADGLETYVDLADFDSPDDFVARGLGFVALDGERVMGAAYSSLVCNRGIEVSLYVDEPYRRGGGGGGPPPPPPSTLPLRRGGAV